LDKLLGNSKEGKSLKGSYMMKMAVNGDLNNIGGLGMYSNK